MAVKNTCADQAWYQAYCAAMLETDPSKIRDGVESARKAIQDRGFELSCSFSANNHESRELDRALRFLNMLLDCSATDDSNILFTRDTYHPTPHTLASAVQ
jgi:hypothetical protein